MSLTYRRGKMMSHVKGCHARNARKRLKTRDNTGNLCSPNRTCIRKEKLFKNVVKRMTVMKVQIKSFKNLPFRINIFIYWIQFYLPHTDEEDDFWKTDEIFYMSTIVPLWNFDFRSRQLTVWRKEGRQEGRKEGTNKRTNERTNEGMSQRTNEPHRPRKQININKGITTFVTNHMKELSFDLTKNVQNSFTYLIIRIGIFSWPKRDWKRTSGLVTTFMISMRTRWRMIGRVCTIKTRETVKTIQCNSVL